MPPKRRKLSPSASSQSSNTTSIPNLNSGPGPSRYLPASSPPLGPEGSESATPGPGPSTQSLALAKTSARAKIQDDRVIAKAGVIVQGSGDGGGCGDECFIWTDLPMNKIGYRYSPCGPSPNPSPFESRPFYRIIPFPLPSPPVHIAWLDRSQYLRLSPDALTATTDRGFRTGRANMSVREGSWYFEATVLRGSGESGAAKGSGGEVGNAHVRVGWGRREAGLDAPVGADGYAYGFRDVGGEYVHCSKSIKTGSGGFGTGDTVGCFIHLPKREKVTQEGNDEEGEENIPIPGGRKGIIDGHRIRLSIRYKAQNYFETEEYPTQKEMEALVDRDGKYAQARAEAAMEALNGSGGRETGDGGVNTGVRGKKTKNVKKGKKVDNKEKDQPFRPENIMANFRELKRLPGSRIEFTINGQSTGSTAFEDLYDYIPLPPTPNISVKKSDIEEKLPDDGSLGYYPMISCFGRGKLKLNFGPDFQFPPTGDGVRAMSERWDEWKEEERILDEREEKELTDLLTKEAEEVKERQILEDKKAAKKASDAAAKRAAAEAKGKMIGSPLSGKSGRVDTGTPTPGPNSTSVPSKLAHDMSVNGNTPNPEDMEGIKDEMSVEDISRQVSPTPFSVRSEGTPLGSVKKAKWIYKGTTRKRGRGRGKGRVSLGRDDPSRANSILSTAIMAPSLDSDGVPVEDEPGAVVNGHNWVMENGENGSGVAQNGEREDDGPINGSKGEKEDRGDMENGQEGEDEDAEGEWDDEQDAEGEMDVDVM